MKTARWHAAKDIRVEDIDEPQVTPGDIKINVALTGVCGSHLHGYLAGPIFVPVGENNLLSHDKAPITMGREYCGEITELGKGVEGFTVSDRVAVEPIYSCGTCDACREGLYNLCKNLGFVDLSSGAGGFAAYSVVPAHMAHKMPEGLSMEQGALVEPAAVALHAVRVSAFKVGDTAAVLGAGPIGLLVVEALRAAGEAEVYVVEPSPERRATAMELDASRAMDPTETDVVAEIRAATGSGVHVAFEMTGVPQVLSQVIDCTRHEGQALIVSIWEDDAAFPPNTVVLSERTIKVTIGYRNIYPAVMELMTSGFFAAEPLVTNRIEIDDIVAEGFGALSSEKSQGEFLVKGPVA